MPYTYPNNVPDYIKSLPVGAQKLFCKGYKSAEINTDEESKMKKAGWSMVKTKYKQSNDVWLKKSLSVQIDGKIEKSSIPNGLPDDLLELPGQMPTVWAMLFNQFVEKGISVPQARDTAWESVKKYVFWSDQKSQWLFKKLKPEEMILTEAIQKTSVKDEGMSHKKYQLFKGSSDNVQGKFKLFMPANISKSADGDDEKLYLK